MMDELAVFIFPKTSISLISDEYWKPLWVAMDIVEALGYVWNGAATVSPVPVQSKGVESYTTPEGVFGDSLGINRSHCTHSFKVLFKMMRTAN
jgi:prophage antirepressor-like protein